MKELLIITIVVWLSVGLAEPFSEYRNELLRLEQELMDSSECWMPSPP